MDRLMHCNQLIAIRHEYDFLSFIAYPPSSNRDICQFDSIIWPKTAFVASKSYTLLISQYKYSAQQIKGIDIPFNLRELNSKNIMDLVKRFNNYMFEVECQKMPSQVIDLKKTFQLFRNFQVIIKEPALKSSQFQKTSIQVGGGS